MRKGTVEPNPFEIRPDCICLWLRDWEGNLHECLVDDRDFPFVSQYRWYARKSYKTFYATARGKSSDTVKTVAMHRLLLNLTDSALEGDHFDWNGLNNRRYNLRVVTGHVNSFHRRGANINNASGYRGVAFHKATGKYIAQVCHKRHYYHLGLFTTPELANAAAVARRSQLLMEKA